MLVCKIGEIIEGAAEALMRAFSAVPSIGKQAHQEAVIMRHSLASSYLSMCLCIVGTTALMLAVGERPQAVGGQPKILAAGMRIGVTSAKF